MQLRQALHSAIERLTSAQVPSPRLNAELLIMFVLDCNRAYLYAHPERKLTPLEVQRYDDSLAQRAAGVPAQYITGHQEFWGLDLIVSPAVLIPRPETEHVVEAVLELITSSAASGMQHVSQQSSSAALVQRHRIVDVGTGSGAISIALAREFPSCKIVATDISAEALAIARTNADRHQLSSRIEFRQADLLAGFPPASVDVVLSNPPYVGESESDCVQLEVRRFEPRIAVFAGPDGHEVIERLIQQAKIVLKPGGWLIFEISGTIASRTLALLAGWSEVRLINDLQGIPRVAVARKSLAS